MSANPGSLSDKRQNRMRVCYPNFCKKYEDLQMGLDIQEGGEHMRTKKYVVAFILAFLFAVLGMPKDVMAATSGSCGTNSTWSYNNGVLTISGKGEVDSRPWREYGDSITKIVIQEGITSIEVMSAFDGYEAVSQVSLPNSLTNIDTYAFYNCTSLQSIIIPKNLTSCGMNCFSGSGLRTVTISEGAKSIPSNLFSHCEKLQTVNFPKSLVEIGNFAFSNCTALESVSIPKGVTKSGTSCFSDSGLKTLTFEEGATVVPGAMFRDCPKLQTIYFPQSIKKIGLEAFSLCPSLQRITLPWYLEEIGFYAFHGCTKLKEITIYQKVKEISDYAFDGVTGLKIYGKPKSTAQTFAKKQGYSFATCKIPALKGITYKKGNLKYKVVNDYIGGKGTVCVTGMVKNASSVTIPKTVKLESYSYKVVKINSKAFYKKGKVKKVTIQSASITSIGKNAFKGINKRAVFKVPKSKYRIYKKMLTSKTGFVKKTMKIKK